MKPFTISESDLTQCPKFQLENRAKGDYKPEKNGPGLTQFTYIASVCKIVEHFKNARFSYVLVLCFSTREKEW